MELAILSEQETAKVIQLLEESRRDNPLIRDRVDQEAEAIAQLADPQSVLDAIKETHAAAEQIAPQTPRSAGNTRDVMSCQRLALLLATINVEQCYPAVVIPVMTQHYAMLQRNLLYTGVTRGKKLVVLVGQKKAVVIAVRNVSGGRRWSKLSEWLGSKKSVDPGNKWSALSGGRGLKIGRHLRPVVISRRDGGTAFCRSNTTPKSPRHMEGGFVG